MGAPYKGFGPVVKRVTGLHGGNRWPVIHYWKRWFSAHALPKMSITAPLTIRQTGATGDPRHRICWLRRAGIAPAYGHHVGVQRE